MSVFPTRILLAVDSSAHAQLAASAAIELANETGSELHVVYVGEFAPPQNTDVDGLLERAIELAKGTTRRVLEEQIASIVATGGAVSGVHARVGCAPDEIVALAGEIEAGLLVVGSRGLGGLKRALMGSVSDSVVRHAHCPVLVVRQVKEVIHVGEAAEVEQSFCP